MELKDVQVLTSEVHKEKMLSHDKLVPSRIYLPTPTHYAWVSTRWTIKDIDRTHQGQFLTANAQIWTNCSLTHDDFVSFFLCSNEIKAP